MTSEATKQIAEKIREIPAGNETLIIETEFPGFTPEEIFVSFTEPKLLTQWWPPQAEVEPGVGGSYHLFWPSPNWHLRGRYTVWEPGKRLAFTWMWDHDPEDTPDRLVTLDLFLSSGGAAMRLEHGPYGDSPEEQEARQGHVEGWDYFLPRLRALRSEA